MTHTEKVMAIQTKELPIFLKKIEKKYGKDFCEKFVSVLIILAEEGEKDTFFTSAFSGNNRNLIRTAQGAVLGIVRLIVTPALPALPDQQKALRAMDIVWQEVFASLAASGIPDKIFAALMRESSDPK